MNYILLALAIIAEVGATLALRMSVYVSRAWVPGAVVGYIVAFSLLALTLAGGVPLGVAYGIWTAAGVAVTAVASRFIFQEPLTLPMCVGIALIVCGVIMIEMGSAH